MVTWEIESLSRSRNASSKTAVNEDRWAVREVVHKQRQVLLAGVMDGAAPLISPDIDSNGLTVGALAAEEAREILLKASVSQTLKSILLQVNRRVRSVNLHHKADYAKPETLCALAASLIRLDGFGNLEYAHIADTVLLLVTNTSSKSLGHDQVHLFDRVPLIKMYQARQRGIFDPQEQVDFARAEMIRMKAMANSADGTGYGALNGMADAWVEMYMETGVLKLTNETKFLALLTDGLLPPPTEIDQTPDLDQIAAILDAKGLGGLYLHTWQIQESDPNLERPRIKMHDDATGILIRLQWMAKNR